MQPGRSSRNALFPNLGQAVLLVVGMLVLQFAFGLGIGLVGAMIGPGDGQAGRLAVNPWILGILNTVAIGAMLAFGLRFTGERPPQFFRVRRFDLSLLPPIVLTSLSLAVLIDQVAKLFFELMRLIPGLPVQDLSEELMATHPIGGFILVVAVAPITEEFLFRGMILRGLLTRHGVWIALLSSTILFGVMHANMLQFVLGIVIGGVFGWWYVRTGSVGPGIVGHAVFNAVAYFGTVFPIHLAPLGPSTGPDIVHQPPWFTLTAVIFSGLGLWWFKGRADDLDALGLPVPLDERAIVDEPATTPESATSPAGPPAPAGADPVPPLLEPEAPSGSPGEPAIEIPPLLGPPSADDLPCANCETSQRAE